MFIGGENKSSKNSILMLLSRILSTLAALPFVDKSTNTARVSGAVTISGTATTNVTTLTNIDGYSGQQMMRQVSISTWCAAVRDRIS